MSSSYFDPYSIILCSPNAVLIAEAVPGPVGLPEDFKVIYMNPAWDRMSGGDNSQYIGKSFSLTPYFGGETLWISIASDVLVSGTEFHKTFYSDVLDKWIDVDIVRVSGELVAAFCLDITESKKNELRLENAAKQIHQSRRELTEKLERIEKLNDQLQHMAYYDMLTHLPNRDRVSIILPEEMRRADAQRSMLGIMCIDIDNLKDINDSLGYKTGDQLITRAAERLRRFEKNGLIPCRFGSSDFLLIVPDLETENHMVTVSDTVLEFLCCPYKIDEEEIELSFSVGIAIYPYDSRNVGELLKFADIAVHEVKRSGKNGAEFFHMFMQDKLLKRINLKNKLARATDDKSFELYFQPQLDITGKRLRGFETLLRWYDHELGWISPEQFIPLAEESKIILRLGDWVLENACGVLSEWRDVYNFQGIVSVNVSPIQLRKHGFVHTIIGFLKTHNIPPQNLELEITEGVFIEDFAETVCVLQQIKDAGIRISLDDFGTGYSSLSYLQILPLTTLKIDKSFIANLTMENSTEQDITESIISLVNKMGLDTIAEGVENIEQLEILQKINCRHTQGFLTGKPMPKEECERYMQKKEFL